MCVHQTYRRRRPGRAPLRSVTSGSVGRTDGFGLALEPHGRCGTSGVSGLGLSPDDILPLLGPRGPFPRVYGGPSGRGAFVSSRRRLVLSLRLLFEG